MQGSSAAPATRSNEWGLVSSRDGGPPTNVLFGEKGNETAFAEMAAPANNALGTPGNDIVIDVCLYFILASDSQRAGRSSAA